MEKKLKTRTDLGPGSNFAARFQSLLTSLRTKCYDPAGVGSCFPKAY